MSSGDDNGRTVARTELATKPKPFVVPQAINAHLRTRGIGSVIPEPDDQKAHRKRIGSSGGRPITYDRAAYRGGLVLAAVVLWLTD